MRNRSPKAVPPPPRKIPGMSRRVPPPARRPSLLLFGLLLFALTLRALVPAGYMPDVQALREGRLALEFCAAAGGLPMALHTPPAPPPVGLPIDGGIVVFFFIALIIGYFITQKIYNKKTPY